MQIHFPLIHNLRFWLWKDYCKKYNKILFSLKVQCAERYRIFSNKWNAHLISKLSGVALKRRGHLFQGKTSNLCEVSTLHHCLFPNDVLYILEQRVRIKCCFYCFIVCILILYVFCVYYLSVKRCGAHLMPGAY